MFTQEDLKLNKFKLDEEASKQASLYHYYSDMLSEKRSEKDKLSVELEKSLGEVELNLRKNPPEGMKITEGVIKSLVAVDKRIVELKEKLAKVKAEIYKLESFVNALDHKKSMLKILTELYVVGYYRFDDFNKTTEAQKIIRKNLNKGV